MEVPMRTLLIAGVVVCLLAGGLVAKATLFPNRAESTEVRPQTISPLDLHRKTDPKRLPESAIEGLI
jgi:hypothetical protein